MAEQKDLPSYECPSYVAGKASREKMRDLQKGTQALRDKSKTYLPKREREKEMYYELRRSVALLFNAVDRTHRGLVGMAFRRPPTFGKDVPVEIAGDETSNVEGQAENIDLMGTHWTVFSKELFSDAMLDGVSFIYVDMSPKLPPGSTLADERAAGRRPYWIRHRADDVINIQPKIVGNRTTLGMAVIRERVSEPDGIYSQKEVTRYRVLRPGTWDLWVEKDSPTGGKEPVWVEGGATSLSYIPLFPCFGRQDGWMKGAPPLLDLADHNIGHYQIYSDYRDTLRTSIPVFVRETNDPSKPVEVIGPYTALDVEIGGKIYFAEPSGTGIEPHRIALKDLKEDMAVLGLSLLVKRTGSGDVTATEELIDKVQEESDLATAVRSLKDCLESALKAHADYASLPTGGSVELGTSLSSLMLTSEELRLLSDMVSQGQLSLESMWAKMVDGEWLRGTFSPEEERALIAKGPVPLEEPIPDDQDTEERGSTNPPPAEASGEGSGASDG